MGTNSATALSEQKEQFKKDLLALTTFLGSFNAKNIKAKENEISMTMDTASLISILNKDVHGTPKLGDLELNLTIPDYKSNTKAVALQEAITKSLQSARYLLGTLDSCTEPEHFASLFKEVGKSGIEAPFMQEMKAQAAINAEVKDKESLQAAAVTTQPTATTAQPQQPTAAQPTNEEKKIIKDSSDFSWKNPGHVSALHDFCKSEYSGENIEFIQAVEKLETLDTSATEYKQLQEHIFNNFYKIGADNEVNLSNAVRNDPQTKKPTINSADDVSVKNITPAVDEIKAMVARDTLSRFIVSEKNNTKKEAVKNLQPTAATPQAANIQDSPEAEAPKTEAPKTESPLDRLRDLGKKLGKKLSGLSDKFPKFKSLSNTLTNIKEMINKRNVKESEPSESKKYADDLKVLAISRMDKIAGAKNLTGQESRQAFDDFIKDTNKIEQSAINDMLRSGSVKELKKKKTFYMGALKECLDNNDFHSAAALNAAMSNFAVERLFDKGFSFDNKTKEAIIETRKARSVHLTDSDVNLMTRCAKLFSADDEMRIYKEAEKNAIDKGLQIIPMESILAKLVGKIIVELDTVIDNIKMDIKKLNNELAEVNDKLKNNPNDRVLIDELNDKKQQLDDKIKQKTLDLQEVVDARQTRFNGATHNFIEIKKLNENLERKNPTLSVIDRLHNQAFIPDKYLGDMTQIVQPRDQNKQAFAKSFDDYLLGTLKENYSKIRDTLDEQKNYVPQPLAKAEHREYLIKLQDNIDNIVQPLRILAKTNGEAKAFLEEKGVALDPDLPKADVPDAAEVGSPEVVAPEGVAPEAEAKDQIGAPVSVDSKIVEPGSNKPDIAPEVESRYDGMLKEMGELSAVDGITIDEAKQALNDTPELQKQPAEAQTQPAADENAQEPNPAAQPAPPVDERTDEDKRRQDEAGKAERLVERFFKEIQKNEVNFANGFLNSSNEQDEGLKNIQKLINVAEKVHKKKPTEATKSLIDLFKISKEIQERSKVIQEIQGVLKEGKDIHSQEKISNLLSKKLEEQSKLIAEASYHTKVCGILDNTTLQKQLGKAIGMDKLGNKNYEKDFERSFMPLVQKGMRLKMPMEEVQQHANNLLTNFSDLITDERKKELEKLRSFTTNLVNKFDDTTKTINTQIKGWEEKDNAKRAAEEKKITPLEELKNLGSYLGDKLRSIKPPHLPTFKSFEGALTAIKNAIAKPDVKTLAPKPVAPQVADLQKFNELNKQATEIRATLDKLESSIPKLSDYKGGDEVKAGRSFDKNMESWQTTHTNNINELNSINMQIRQLINQHPDIEKEANKLMAEQKQENPDPQVDVNTPLAGSDELDLTAKEMTKTENAQGDKKNEAYLDKLNDTFKDLPGDEQVIAAEKQSKGIAEPDILPSSNEELGNILHGMPSSDNEPEALAPALEQIEAEAQKVEAPKADAIQRYGETQFDATLRQLRDKIKTKENFENHLNDLIKDKAILSTTEVQALSAHLGGLEGAKNTITPLAKNLNEFVKDNRGRREARDNPQAAAQTHNTEPKPALTCFFNKIKEAAKGNSAISNNDKKENVEPENAQKDKRAKRN